MKGIARKWFLNTESSDNCRWYHLSSQIGLLEFSLCQNQCICHVLS